MPESETLLENKTYFPYEVEYEGKKYKDGWTRIENGLLYFYVRENRHVVAKIEGEEVLAQKSAVDSALPESEIKRRKKTNKKTDEIIFELDSGNVVLRHRGSCGCGNPLKHKKTLQQVRSLAAVDQSRQESREAREAAKKAAQDAKRENALKKREERKNRMEG